MHVWFIDILFHLDLLIEDLHNPIMDSGLFWPFQMSLVHPKQNYKFES